MQAIEVVTKAKWTIDPVYSTIGFRVKHLKVSNLECIHCIKRCGSWIGFESPLAYNNTPNGRC